VNLRILVVDADEYMLMESCLPADHDTNVGRHLDEKDARLCEAFGCGAGRQKPAQDVEPAAGIDEAVVHQ